METGHSGSSSENAQRGFSVTRNEFHVTTTSPACSPGAVIKFSLITALARESRRLTQEELTLDNTIDYSESKLSSAKGRCIERDQELKNPRGCTAPAQPPTELKESDPVGATRPEEPQVCGPIATAPTVVAITRQTFAWTCRRWRRWWIRNTIGSQSKRRSSPTGFWHPFDLGQ